MPMGPNWSNGWGIGGGCGAEEPSTQVALSKHLEGEGENVQWSKLMQNLNHGTTLVK